jgi:hypothetical protein
MLRSEIMRKVFDSGSAARAGEFNEKSKREVVEPGIGWALLPVLVCAWQSLC